MPLAKIKLSKNKLEKDINSLIKSYEKETGIKVINISNPNNIEINVYADVDKITLPVYQEH